MFQNTWGLRYLCTPAAANSASMVHLLYLSCLTEEPEERGGKVTENFPYSSCNTSPSPQPLLEIKEFLLNFLCPCMHSSRICSSETNQGAMKEKKKKNKSKPKEQQRSFKSLLNTPNVVDFHDHQSRFVYSFQGFGCSGGGRGRAHTQSTDTRVWSFP